MVLKEEHVWRIIPTIGLMFTMLVIIANIVIYQSPDFADDHPFETTFVMATNSLTVLAFLYLAIFPPRLPLYAALCAFHGILNIVTGGDIIGFLLYILGAAFLFRGGHLKTGARPKVFALVTVLLAALLTQFRFGTARFLHSLLYIVILAIIFGLLLFLFTPYLASLLPEPLVKRAIDLAPLKLKPRDLDFLRRVINNEKYDSIANAYRVSESTIKQRMVVLYRKLGVDNRSAFLQLALKNDLIFPEEESAGTEHDPDGKEEAFNPD